VTQKSKKSKKKPMAAPKPDVLNAELGKVAKGWERTVTYKEKGKSKTGAAKGKEVTTFQVNIGLADSEDLKKLKEEITKVELSLMQYARDLSTGVADQKDVVVARILGSSACLADIVHDLTSVWEKKFTAPAIEMAKAQEKIK
jgi:hypothetical protein